MKVALCSVPKSGTYLVSNFLKELGFEDSRLHLNDNEYSDYSGSSLELARKSPEKYRVKASFKDAINTIKDNQFVVGHFSVKNRINLAAFKTIFLYRDLGDASISFAVWTQKTNRWRTNEKQDKWRNNVDSKDFVVDFLKEHGSSITALFKKTVPWIREEGVLKLKFEHLTGIYGREVQINEFHKITTFLEFDIERSKLETKISNCLNKNSLTKINSIVDYSFYKNKLFDNWYNRSEIKKLNKILGYGYRLNFSKLWEFPKKSSFYDIYWKTNKKSKNSWNYGINVIDQLINRYEFNTILDAGCGSADVVRYLMAKGFDAKGIELSGNALREHAPDLLRKKIVQQGSLTKLPFEDNYFDVVFSSEVLEHIPEEEIPMVISEIVRVTKKVIFLTISLRPSSNFNKYHINIKSRNWWEDKFMIHSLEKMDKHINELQLFKENASVKEILEIGPTKTHIHEMEWFIENPPFDYNGELEPWYFIFEKNA